MTSKQLPDIEHLRLRPSRLPLKPRPNMMPDEDSFEAEIAADELRDIEDQINFEEEFSDAEIEEMRNYP